MHPSFTPIILAHTVAALAAVALGAAMFLARKGTFTAPRRRPHLGRADAGGRRLELLDQVERQLLVDPRPVGHGDRPARPGCVLRDHPPHRAATAA